MREVRVGADRVAGDAGGKAAALALVTSMEAEPPNGTGIDKAHGVRKLHETLGIAVADMIFVGDAIFPGGNDYPAKQAGAEFIRVRATRMKRSVSPKRSAHT